MIKKPSNTFAQLSFSDGTESTINCKFSLLSTKTWVQCLKFTGRPNRKTWMPSFSFSLVKWSSSPLRMMLSSFTKCSKRSSRNFLNSWWLVFGANKSWSLSRNSLIKASPSLWWTNLMTLCTEANTESSGVKLIKSSLQVFIWTWKTRRIKKDGSWLFMLLISMKASQKGWEARRKKIALRICKKNPKKHVWFCSILKATNFTLKNSKLIKNYTRSAEWSTVIDQLSCSYVKAHRFT